MDVRRVTLFWGKQSKGTPPAIHPLVCHLLDAAGVAGALWSAGLHGRVRGLLAGAFGLDQEAAGKWVAFWASLHDLGKATPAFQIQAETTCPAVLQALRAAGFGFAHADPRQPKSHHTCLGRIALDEVLTAHDVPWQVDGRLARDIATVISGHHGVFPLSAGGTGLGHHLGRDRWTDARRELVEFLAGRWNVGGLPRPRPPTTDAQAAYMVLAGLVSVADWIASCEQYFPYARPGEDLPAYEAGLPAKTTSALKAAGWHEWRPTHDPLDFGRMFPRLSPNEMQRRTMTAAKELTGPGLIVIEAPMGLGKTEAALAVVQDCLGRFDQQGVYIALPTQATSNQMFDRFIKFAPHVVGEGQANIQLAHGRKALNDWYKSLRLRVNEDEESPEDTVLVEEWFASSKRALLAPLAVGTVDQGLFGILQTKHFFVRLFGLAGKVVILDEVHAYDTYTSRLLEHLLLWLGRMGCTVVLLSATLPRAKRQALVRAYLGPKAPHAVEDVPYPRITVGSGAQVRSIALTEALRRVVAVESIPADAMGIARRLGQALAGGGCAACICNTVQRAQDVFRAVRDQLGGQGFQLDLLHARFPLGQRKQKEDQVVARFGKEAWKRAGQEDGRPRKAVLVATQVIEQSLDLDFDVMVTDLAPVDLVLQRAGRLHRHEKVDDQPVARPAALADPCLWLAVPEVGPDGVPRFGTDEWVYEPYVLLRSYLCLVSSGVSAVRIPEDLEPLIERVYGDGELPLPTQAWREVLDAALADMRRAEGKDTFGAELKLIPDPDAPDGLLDEFNQGLPDDEDMAARWRGGLTRKTRPSVTVVCLHQAAGRLYLDAEAHMPVDLAQPPDAATTVALLNQSVAVNRAAVVWHFRENHPEPPQAWRRVPVLRHCRPLALEGGTCRIGALSVRLDQDLGIVLERPPAGPSEGD